MRDMTPEFRGRVTNCIVQGGMKILAGDPLFIPRQDGVLVPNLNEMLLRPIVSADRRSHGVTLGGLWWHLVAGFQVWRMMRETLVLMPQSVTWDPKWWFHSSPDAPGPVHQYALRPDTRQGGP